MRNLQREFPNSNFEIVGRAPRQVRVGTIGVDSIMRTVYDIHVVRCLDYDIAFSTRDGSGRLVYLRALFQEHISHWNTQLSNDLATALQHIYVTTYNPQLEIIFYTHCNEETTSQPSQRISSVEGAYLWLRDINSPMEGINTISNHDDTGKIVLEISYTVKLNHLNTNAELESIRSLASAFILPLYNMLDTAGERLIVNINIDFLRLDSNNPNQDIRLGRFWLRHDSLTDRRLEDVISSNIWGDFEISAIYGKFSDNVNFEGHALLGAWGAHTHRMRQYHFYKDGTGRITHSGGQEFFWRIYQEEYLTIAFINDGALWTQEGDSIYITYPHSITMPLALTGNSLTLQVRMGSTGIGTESYTRVELPSHLHGTWVWANDSNWITTINGDGTGSRGFLICDDCTDCKHDFRWIVDAEDRYLWKVEEGRNKEQWSYEFEGDVLVLTRWYTETGQQRGERFRYARLNDTAYTAP